MKIKRTKQVYKRNYKFRKVIISIVAVIALLALGWAVSMFVGAHGGNPASTKTNSSSQSSTSGNTSSTTSSVTSTTASNAAIADIKAISAGPADVKDLQSLDNFCASAKSSGANNVIIDVKNDDGYMLYTDVGINPASNGAITYKKLASNNTYAAYERLDDVVNTIHKSGLKAVARINCFNDPVNGSHISGSQFTLLKTPSYTWIDNSSANGGKSWLNPYSDSAKAFNLAIASDCKQFGFDAIVADYVQFPVGVGLSKANYGTSDSPANRMAELSGFVENMITTTNLPVYLTVRNLSTAGSQEFGGSPFTMQVNNLAGYIAVLNAPANPRKTSATTVSDGAITTQSAKIPTNVTNAISAVIGSAPQSLLQMSEYVILN